MFLTLELSTRQATRVLEQAVRSRAMLQIEPRSFPDNEPIVAHLVGRTGLLLEVELSRRCPLDRPTSLIGSVCDVRLLLSDHLYVFSTCVADATDVAAVRQLVLSAPETIQLVNRRRFERKRVLTVSPVQLWTHDSTAGPYDAQLVDISPDGLACQGPKNPLEDHLLVGDAVRVRFELPSGGPPFELPAIVCDKSPAADPQSIVAHLQFDLCPGDSETGRAFRRLSARLCDPVIDSSPHGDA